MEKAPRKEHILHLVDLYAQHLILADQALRVNLQENAQDHIDAAANLKLDIENELDKVI